MFSLFKKRKIAIYFSPNTHTITSWHNKFTRPTLGFLSLESYRYWTNNDEVVIVKVNRNKIDYLTKEMVVFDLE